MPLEGAGSKSLTEVFSSFLKVPPFQREYAWEQENVLALLNDIHKAHEEGLEIYFVGALVFAQSSDLSYSIIDGQQRLTTLYILLCALYAKSNALEVAALKESIGPLLRHQKYDHERKKHVATHRLEPSYKDAADLIAVLATGPKRAEEAASGPADLMANAYNDCRKWVDDNLDSEEKLAAFFDFLGNKTSFLVHIAKTIEEGLKIFEVLNTRGVQLSSLDLVKHLLFDRAPQSMWEKLKDDWKEFEALYDSLQEQKSERFLRYFIIVEFCPQRNIKEDEAHSWLKESANDIIATPVAVQQFLGRLSDFAKRWSYINAGQRPDESVSFQFQDLRALTRSSRQHYPVLLATFAKSHEDMDRIARGVEMYQLGLSLLREFTGSVEGTYLEWSRELARSGSQIDEEWYQSKFVVECQETIRRALEKVRTTPASQFNRAKIVYLLKKMEVYARRIADASDQSISNFYRGHDIEHLWPVNKVGKHDSEGRIVDEDIVQRVGNLCLLEKSLNSKVKDSDFAKKRKDAYSKSVLYNAKAIVIVPNGSSKVDKALRLFDQYEVWGASQIEDRSDKLAALLMQIYSMD